MSRGVTPHGTFRRGVVADVQLNVRQAGGNACAMGARHFYRAVELHFISFSETDTLTSCAAMVDGLG